MGTDILTEGVEATEAAVKSGFGKRLGNTAGVGLLLAVGVMVYKRVVKPAMRKAREKGDAVLVSKKDLNDFEEDEG